MKRRIATWIGVCVTWLAAAPAAQAHKVYFNGVEVEAGLSGQSFANVEVRFDEAGNVWITARGYAVKVMDGGKKKVVGAAPATAPASATPAPTVPTAPATSGPAKPQPPAKPMSVARPAASEALTKHYYLVALQSRLGAAQYDIDVFVNSKWVKKVRSHDAHVVVDITPQVKLGANSIHFSAVKNYEGAKRMSTSPTDTMSVVVGEGTIAAGTCMIDTPVAKLELSAADTQSQSSETSFVGR